MSTTPTTPAVLPAPGPLLTRTGWSAFVVALLVVCAVAPLLNLFVPEGSAFHLSDYMVGLLGKIMCYAIVALAMDLIWGYAGILSLGHGLFFALGFAGKFLETWSGAVLAKIAVLVFIIIFIQRRPQGMFALKGRAVEA